MSQSSMDWEVLLLLAIFVLVIGRLFLRPGTGGREQPGRDGDDDAEPGADAPRTHRVTDLCEQLTGDVRRDRVVQNRILALGPGVLPLLLDAHAQALKGTEGMRPAVLARFEETLSDFGLAVVPVAVAALARLNPTSPPAVSLLRVIARLGPGGAAPALRACLAGQPALGPFLPRWRLPSVTRDPAALLVQALRDRPAASRQVDLDTLAGLVGDHPVVLEDLWARWAREVDGRQALLELQLDWLPLAQPELVARAMADSAPAIRLAGLRLAALLHAHVPALMETVRSLAATEPDDAVREAAVRALSLDPSPASRAGLESARGDPCLPVRIAARHALRLLPHVAGPGVAPGGEGPAADPEGALLDAADRGDVDTLLAAIDTADAPEGAECRPTRACLLAAELLAEHAGRDPRAKERLFRATEGRDYAMAAAAALALARAGESQATELLARVIRDPTPPEILHTLQEAAQVLGPAAAVPLARRLRGDGGARVDALLSTLRAVPYASAVPPLLRALEASRGTRAEGQIAATLALGGPEVRAVLNTALQQPGRGLLTPALAWLSAYATPADLPILLELLDRHPPLRGIVLGLIEAQGEPARDALRARIPKGGDDGALLAMEQRLQVLEACLGFRGAA